MEVFYLKKIDTEKVKQFYEEVNDVWQKDKWYTYSRKIIEKFILNQNIPTNHYILNAGSGGSVYNLSNKMEHLDLAENKINIFPNYTVGSIENTIYPDNSFDCVICVGSVLNYTDALASISEISRVLKRNGQLILEFESSWGFEHLKTKAYKKDAEILDLKYYNSYHKQWVYSPSYIENILNSYGFKITMDKKFHILSSLHFRFSQNENKAAYFDKFDSLLEKIPYFKNHSDNLIISAIKL